MQDKSENFYALVRVLYRDNRNPGLTEVKKWFENSFLPLVSELADSVKLVEYAALKHPPEVGKTLSRGAEVKIAVAGAKPGMHEAIFKALAKGKKEVPWLGRYDVFLLKKVNWWKKEKSSRSRSESSPSDDTSDS